jgi:hypothetical protein
MRSTALSRPSSAEIVALGPRASIPEPTQAQVLSLWPTAVEERFAIRSVTTQDAERLTSDGSAIELQHAAEWPDDPQKVLFVPPTIDLQVLAGEYSSPAEFEHAYFARCPLLTSLGKSLLQCGRNGRALFASLAGGARSPLPSTVATLGEINRHFPVLRETLDTRSELLELLERRTVAIRRTEIRALYSAGRLVALKCRDDASGDLEPIGPGHFQRPSTVLRSGRLHVQLGSGRVVWEIRKVVCERPVPATDVSPIEPSVPYKAELLCERWLKGLICSEPEKPKRKDALWADARRQFPNLSRRAFDRAWARAIVGTRWGEAGRPRNS